MVNLLWIFLFDKRVVYYVYEKKGDKVEVIGKVKGKGVFEKECVNLFDSFIYYVVFYNF